MYFLVPGLAMPFFKLVLTSIYPKLELTSLFHGLMTTYVEFFGLIGTFQFHVGLGLCIMLEQLT